MRNSVQIAISYPLFTQYVRTFIALSSNGRTQDSGSCYHGSSPCGATNLNSQVLDRCKKYNRFLKTRKNRLLKDSSPDFVTSS